MYWTRAAHAQSPFTIVRCAGAIKGVLFAALLAVLLSWLLNGVSVLLKTARHRHFYGQKADN